MPYIIPWGSNIGGDCPAPYNPFTLSCSVNPITGLHEIGTNFSPVIATGTVLKGSADITSVQFLKNGSVIHTPSPVTSGGTFTYTDNIPVDAATTYTVRVTDGTTTKNCQNTYEFIYPYYIGAVSATNPDKIEVQALTKVLAKQSTVIYSYNAPTLMYPAIFIPVAGWSGTLQIKDENGFPVTNIFIKGTINLDVNSNALNVPYISYIDMYETKLQNYTVTFIPQ